MKSLHALLFFIAFSSFAQIRFEPGYYIDNSGTRHDVLIRNVGWKNNPTAFDYKITETSDSQNNTIANTKEFSVGSDTYKRFEVKIDRSGNNTDRMSESPVIDWKTETLLLNMLADGKLRLYQYEDNNLIRYFYSEGEHTNATHLIFREYKQDGRIIPNNGFRQQLYSLMKDKYADPQKFKDTKYTKSALIKLFEDYNGTAQADTKSKGSGSFHLNVAAGTTFSVLSLSALNSSYTHDFDSKTGLRAGIQLEYIFPFNRNKWALLLDPNYQSYSAESTKGTNTFKTDYQRIELPVLVRHYFFISEKSRLFINGSYAMSLALGDSNIQQNSSVPVEIGNNSSWALGAGYSYNKFNLEARYTFKHGITSESFWLTDFSSLQLILAYRLF